MTFSISSDATPIVLKIEGELDAVTVPELRAAIDRLADSRPTQVVVDLSFLRVIDSSGVGAIVSLYKRVRATGGDVRVIGLRDQPLAIFQLLRLDRVLVGPR
ncbi:MAG TPA: STAS domain-containing protein [Polyangia bacterium]|jgi:anti-sigma B factor antagonist|nr:STAS domain-containing protein [Polyangia bacterium]